MANEDVKLIIGADTSDVEAGVNQANAAMNRLGRGTNLETPITEMKEMGAGAKNLGRALSSLQSIPVIGGVAQAGTDIAHVGSVAVYAAKALKELGKVSWTALGSGGTAGAAGLAVFAGYQLGKIIDELAYKFLKIDISGMNKVKDIIKATEAEMKNLSAQADASEKKLAKMGIGTGDTAAAEKTARARAKEIGMTKDETEAYVASAGARTRRAEAIRMENEGLLVRDKITGELLTREEYLKKEWEEAGKETEKITAATKEWNDAVDALNPSLDETARAAAKLIEESEKAAKAGVDTSARLNEGLAMLAQKKFLEDARKTFTTVKDEAMSRFEMEKSQYSSLIENAKAYRSELVGAYDYAKASAAAFYDEAKKIDSLITKGKGFLASLHPEKVSPQDQMRRDKEAVDAAISSAWIGRDTGKVENAMSAIEEYMTKYKDTKDLLGFSTDFIGLEDEYTGLLDKLGLMGSETERAAQGWEMMAQRQITAINDVDQWMVYLEQQVQYFDGLMANTKVIKLDTSDAEGKVAALTEKVRNLMALIGESAASASAASGVMMNNIEGQIADNMASGRSPLTKAIQNAGIFNNEGATYVP